MKDIISSIFLNPDSNPFSESNRIGTAFQECNRIIPIISYPRSRNGWIRCLIAAYLIAKHEAVEPSNIDVLALKKVEDSAAGIAVSDHPPYPIDLIIPDVYFFASGSYAKFEQLNAAIRCQSILAQLKYLPVKTHHAAHPLDAFNAVSVLVRNPEEAVTSAGLLLCPELSKLSESDLNDYAESLVNSYERFMVIVRDLLGLKPTVIIDTANPYPGLIRLFSVMGIDNVDIALLKAICLKFPSKSGYNKDSPLNQKVKDLCQKRCLNDYYHLLRV
jgi:hypothetical protein